MKKFLVILLATICALSFVACSPTSSNNESSGGSYDNSYEDSSGNSSNDSPSKPSQPTLPSSISLSSSSITLNIGETYQLYTTISPSSANQTVSFSSTNNNCSTVSKDGLISAKTSGTTVIRAETVNGLVASCTVTVITAKGSISGCITYKKLGASSYSGDSGTIIQLIPANLKEVPSDYDIGTSYNFESVGIYQTETDIDGNYNISDVPAGDYLILISSGNTKNRSEDTLEYLTNPDKIKSKYGEDLGNSVLNSSNFKYVQSRFALFFTVIHKVTISANKDTNKTVSFLDLS